MALGVSQEKLDILTSGRSQYHRGEDHADHGDCLFGASAYLTIKIGEVFTWVDQLCNYCRTADTTFTVMISGWLTMFEAVERGEVERG